MNSKEKIAYSWRVQDVTWTPTGDSLATVQTLSEHGFFFFIEVSFSEPRSVAQKQKLIHRLTD